MGEGGKPEQGARPDGTNNFQGRYAIRHPWTGPIACKQPVRGRWGGPPTDQASARPKPALDLAFARRDLALASFAPKVPEANLLGAPGAPPGGGSTDPALDAGADTTDAAAQPPATPGGPRGCGGCNAGAGSESVLASLFALVSLAVLRQRRKR
jgi:uncharacterized protein (TIGR03382 family)